MDGKRSTGRTTSERQNGPMKHSKKSKTKRTRGARALEASEYMQGYAAGHADARARELEARVRVEAAIACIASALEALASRP